MLLLIPMLATGADDAEDADDGDGGDDGGDDGDDSRYRQLEDGRDDGDYSDAFHLSIIETARAAATPPPRQGGAHVLSLKLVIKV